MTKHLLSRLAFKRFLHLLFVSFQIWQFYSLPSCNTCQISNTSNIIKHNNVKRCWFCYFSSWFFQRVYLKCVDILRTLSLYDLLLCGVSNKDDGNDQKQKQTKKCSQRSRHFLLFSRKFYLLFVERKSNSRKLTLRHSL